MLLELIHSIKWSPDGKMLASGGSDTRINLFDFESEKRIYTTLTTDSRKQLFFFEIDELNLIYIRLCKFNLFCSSEKVNRVPQLINGHNQDKLMNDL